MQNGQLFPFLSFPRLANHPELIDGARGKEGGAVNGKRVLSIEASHPRVSIPFSLLRRVRRNGKLAEVTAAALMTVEIDGSCGGSALFVVVFCGVDVMEGKGKEKKIRKKKSRSRRGVSSELLVVKVVVVVVSVRYNAVRL